MNDEIREYLEKLYFDGIKPLIVEEKDYAYIRDPVFKINRNRVVAEVLMGLMKSGMEKDEQLLKKLFNFLQKRQNLDGSWNEIHVNYDNPATLITAICGSAFLMGEKKGLINDHTIADRAKDYLLDNIIELGYFRKSEKYDADFLNVNATNGAFLAEYWESRGDEKARKAALDAGLRIASQQWENGSYPYTSNKGNFPQHLIVPCIHYQGVTLYYLIKLNKILKDEKIESSIKKGTKWLASVQKKNGSFKWTRSGMVFALYLTGAYGFATSVFLNQDMTTHAKRSFHILKKNTRTLANRWQSENKIKLLVNLIFPLRPLRIALIGNYYLKERIVRYGYSYYKEFNRIIFRETYNDKFFEIIIKILHQKISTTEPSKNFPDLFMTTEIFER